LLLVLASTVVLGIGIYDHIFVHSRLSRVLKRGLLFDERRGLTTTDHSPSIGE
jgi:hypothetical protein